MIAKTNDAPKYDNTPVKPKVELLYINFGGKRFQITREMLDDCVLIDKKIVELSNTLREVEQA